MERKILLWIVIGILFVAVLFLIFKVSTGNVVQSAGSAVESVASSGGMVGGC